VGLLAYSNGFGIYRKILDGENIPTQELTYFLNLQDTIAPSALKRQSYIRKLRVKWLTLTELSLAFIEQQSL
jgi:hypothetical protein